MSLTSLLDGNQSVKEHFKSLPKLKPFFKSFFEDRKPFDKSQLAVPSPADFPSSQASMVGTAYDVFLNAYIQRINQIIVQKELPNIIAASKLLLIDRMEDYRHYCALEESLNKVYELRSSYINGKTPFDLKKFAEGLLVWANVITFFRSGYVSDFLDVNPKAVEDVVNLMEYTLKRSDYFKINQYYVPTPTFGKNSLRVGGADGDFILDDMLVDVKVTKNFGFKSDHTNQLIGYYLLDFYEKLPEEDKQRFSKIGLFFPRQDQFVYMDIGDLRRVFDLDGFAIQFYEII